MIRPPEAMLVFMQLPLDSTITPGAVCMPCLIEALQHQH